MVVTTNEDFSVVTIQSDNLTDFSNIDSVTLTSKIDCGSTTYTDTIVEGDVTLATGTFAVDFNALYNLSSLSDGIYSFALTITPTSGNTTIEYSCLFVDAQMACDVRKCVKDKQNIEIMLDHFILGRGQDCDCDCEDLCKIYKRLKNELTCCEGC